MRRRILIKAILSLAFMASPVLAADDGGFGAAFTGKAPSALMEAPNSQVAQSVQTPLDAKDLQQIIPAAGDESDSTSDTAQTPSVIAPASPGPINPVTPEKETPSSPLKD